MILANIPRGFHAPHLVVKSGKDSLPSLGKPIALCLKLLQAGAGERGEGRGERGEGRGERGEVCNVTNFANSALWAV